MRTATMGWNLSSFLPYCTHYSRYKCSSNATHDYLYLFSSLISCRYERSVLYVLQALAYRSMVVYKFNFRKSVAVTL